MRNRNQIFKDKHNKWLESGKGFNGRMCLTYMEKEKVFERANYRCEVCGKEKEKIQKRFWFEIRLVVHHLCYPPLSYDDLQAVCYSCHNKIFKSNGGT